ncbi:ATP-binding cassette domain-containing protein [Tessaracoccus defluvii]|uniref:ATP-binding cassette domain-containing protein n=1 Tax=Tessaracoccus defluvii TaxID=1285901 RepID=A0A7H0H8W0_9ACTN|nr:ATP-binding cassette domain-containing protein [Tessaracoccus defluvii]QNP56976.1 ATP-binding cassette domain-containing protein [Tessaracoccus defluvii]
MTAPELISADGVYVSIGGMPVLRDVSLQVSEGEAVALIGGNGSGKSTLVRTLLGILPHQEGTISLFGQEVPGFKDWSKIGYVPSTARWRSRTAPSARSCRPDDSPTARPSSG